MMMELTEKQEYSDRYVEELDESVEGFNTEADTQKKRIISFLKGNASIPFELYDKATWEYKLKGKRYKGQNRRITGSVYIDCIVLYGFLQYVRHWHERDCRVEDDTIYCTRNYVCNALHWGYHRYAESMKILEVLGLVKRKQYPITDIKTKQKKGSYTRLQIIDIPRPCL
jgi:hypothetical protein